MLSLEINLFFYKDGLAAIPDLVGGVWPKFFSDGSLLVAT